MISYRDRTFCASDCMNGKCPRFVTEDMRRHAKMLNLPFALTDFSKSCPDYSYVDHDLSDIEIRVLAWAAEKPDEYTKRVLGL